MVDRTMKLILVAIALGVWTDVALHFRRASAWGESDFGSELSSIEESIHNIAMGKCLNARLCGQ
jgi:hypothetical protein